MDKDKLITRIKSILPAAEVVEAKQFVEVTVPAATLHSFAQTLKESSDLAFDYLFSLSGVDFQTHSSVVYHVESTSLNHQLVIKVKTENNINPTVDSVSDIWQTAEYHEREVYDLLGVKFNNHPDLRRLFLDDDWGFPLRKDYKDEINIIER